MFWDYCPCGCKCSSYSPQGSFDSAMDAGRKYYGELVFWNRSFHFAGEISGYALYVDGHGIHGSPVGRYGTLGELEEVVRQKVAEIKQDSRWATMARHWPN